MGVTVATACETGKGTMKMEKSVIEEEERMVEHMRHASRKERKQEWRWRGEGGSNKSQLSLKIHNKT